MTAPEKDSVRGILSAIYGTAPEDAPLAVAGSSGIDRTKYHSAGSVRDANGVAMSARLPSAIEGKGTLRGTILPSHTIDGGSLGFDSNTPARAFIDPDQTGKSLSVDLTEFSKEEVNLAFAEANKTYPSSVQARGVATYAILAELAKAKARQAELPREALLQTDHIQPEPLSRQGQEEPSGSILRNIRNQPSARTSTMPQSQPVASRRVDFELPKPFGVLTCYYYDVLRTDNLLILVYQEGNKWFPTEPDDDDPGEPTAIGVLVYDKEGRKDTAFAALPTPVRFAFQGYELCVLAIEGEKSYKEVEKRHVHQVQPFAG